ncbi:alpha/beta hydrolase [Aquiluna sp.]|nr:alpha/beta hydrolase [Aquiluna sp.]MDA8992913.1 alpha/beta hydrolase [Aquiluna sp.]
MKKILIHHGWTNIRPEGHWARIAAAELRSGGNQVWYPQFPDPDTPSAEKWQELLRQEANMMDEVADGEKIAICHSLGTTNWLIAAMNDLFTKPFDRVLLVAPPRPAANRPGRRNRGRPAGSH